MDNQTTPDSSTSPEPANKSKTIKLVITLVIILAIGGMILLLSSGGDSPDPTSPTSSEESANQASSAEDSNPAEPSLTGEVTSPSTDGESGDSSQTSGSDPALDGGSDANQQEVVHNNPALAAGQYVDYQDQQQLDQLASRDRWLNFHADWCPYCVFLNDNINDNFDQIPAGVTIIKISFDDEGDLRRRYEVTRQTTIVRIDADGNEIKRFSGYGNNSTLDSLKSTFGY